MKVLVAGAVLAALLASPALAQSYDPDLGTGNIAPWNYSTTNTRDVPQRGHNGFARVAPGGAASAYSAFGAVTPFGAPVGTGSGGNHMNAAREQALHECTGIARRYQQTTWGHMELFQFRSCMAQHGQME